MLKKDKYKAPCIARQWMLDPLLVYSVDGMAYNEAKTFEKRGVLLLATTTEHDRRYSEMLVSIWAWTLLVFIFSITLLPCGARVGRAFRTDIRDEAAFGLMGGVRE